MPLLVRWVAEALRLLVSRRLSEKLIQTIDHCDGCRDALRLGTFSRGTHTFHRSVEREDEPPQHPAPANTVAVLFLNHILNNYFISLISAFAQEQHRTRVTASRRRCASGCISVWSVPHTRRMERDPPPPVRPRTFRTPVQRVRKEGLRLRAELFEINTS